MSNSQIFPPCAKEGQWNQTSLCGDNTCRASGDLGVPTFPRMLRTYASTPCFASTKKSVIDAGSSFSATYLESSLPDRNADRLSSQISPLALGSMLLNRIRYTLEVYLKVLMCIITPNSISPQLRFVHILRARSRAPITRPRPRPGGARFSILPSAVHAFS
jgi:hypothetical protein